MQRRITTNVLFANLIYDLIHARPALREIHRPIYSAGPWELEELLRKATDQGIIDEATLIVDGIDHISRVFAEQRNLSPEDVDIVEELAALDLPDSIRLVVGSQPGAHLDPLRIGAATIVVPGWELDEVTALANNLGVPSALESSGLGDTVDGFLEQLLERSEGNPLYATFLCRQTLAGITANAAFDPVSALREAPLIDGQISRYYKYLLDGLEKGNTTDIIADLLGLIDFGVTEEDLKAIFPVLARHIPAALLYLSPVLTRLSAQGGVRIYHESFRRLIVERLKGGRVGRRRYCSGNRVAEGARLLRGRQGVSVLASLLEAGRAQPRGIGDGRCPVRIVQRLRGALKAGNRGEPETRNVYCCG